MPKYINADELINQLEEFRSNADNDYADGKNGMIDVVRILIAEMPTADVVEVIRCKDCKKYKPYENDNFPCGECGNCSYDVRPRVVGDNDYCSDGERKEEE